MRQTSEPPSFLHTLKGLLAKAPVPSTCSSYSRLILLHGLFSVTANLHARDLATLGVGRPASSSDETGTTTNSSSTPPYVGSPPYAMDIWKDILERAIDTWSFSLLSRDPSLSLQAARTLHHMAHVAIHTNIIDFHIVAGAPPLLGSTLSRNDCVKAKARVCAWSKRPEAKKALYHCLRLVQDTVFTGGRYRASEDNIALRSWCLYHATLVLWAYGYMVEENDASENKGGGGPEVTKQQQQNKRRRVVTNRQVSSLGGRVDPTMLATDGDAMKSDMRTESRKDSVAFGAEEYLVRMLMLLEGGGSNSNSNSALKTLTTSTSTTNHSPNNLDGERDIGYAPPNSTSSTGGGANATAMLEGANQTRDLILFVREGLVGCRWELLQEAYDTLGRLVGIGPPASATSAAANPGPGPEPGSAGPAAANVNQNMNVNANATAAGVPPVPPVPTTAAAAAAAAATGAAGVGTTAANFSVPGSGMAASAPVGTWR